MRTAASPQAIPLTRGSLPRKKWNGDTATQSWKDSDTGKNDHVK